MGKIERKARTKLILTVDTLKPLSVFELGSENDPCFGKHFNPQTSECSRCGDSEICAIKMGQITNLKREVIESKQSFKDIEEKDIPKSTKKEIRLTIKKRIRELIKLSGAKGITEDAIVNEIHLTYAKDGFVKQRIKKILKEIVEKSLNIDYKNNKLIWNK